jgi:transglycosylase-like protein
MIAEAIVALALSTPAHHQKPTCNTVKCEVRVATRVKERVVRPWNAKLMRMAWCESRQRWHIATGNGFFGGLQFTLQSWRTVGGRGMPHWATPLEQKYRAVRLIHRQGLGAWPVCQYA